MNMRHAFFSLAAVGLSLCLGQNALAADMPIKGPKAAPPAPPPPSWTGFYLGANFGAAWSDDVTFTAADPFNSQGFQNRAAPVSVSSSDFGPFLGLLAGYNWQLASNWLIGAEGDIDWGWLNNDASQSPVLNTAGIQLGGGAGGLRDSVASSHLGVNMLSSARGRAGFIWNNNWLFYGTGGWAWAHAQYNADLIGPSNVSPVVHAPVALTSTISGSVFGGGVEYKGNETLTFGVEYLNFHFNNSNNLLGTPVNDATGVPTKFGACPGGPGTPCVPYTSGALTIQEVRVRATYKLF